LVLFLAGFVVELEKERSGRSRKRLARWLAYPDKTLEPEKSFYTGEFHVKRALMIL